VGLPQVQIHLVAVKVGVVRRGDSEVETQRREGHHLDAMPHHGHLVQRRLPVEDDVVAVQHVPLDDPAILQLDLAQVLDVPQVLPRVVRLHDEAGARPSHRSVSNVTPELVDVVWRDPLREGQIERDRSRHTHLLRVQVRVTSDHAARAVVHALAHQGATQSPFLGLQPLADGLQGPLRLRGRLRNADDAVVVQRVNVVLQQLGKLHDVVLTSA